MNKPRAGNWRITVAGSFHEIAGDFVYEPQYGQGTSGRHRAPKKRPKPLAKSRDGSTTRIHMVAADVRQAITLPSRPSKPTPLQRGASCCVAEGDETRQLALDSGFGPVVRPSRIDSLRGSTTARCRSDVTRSCGYSDSTDSAHFVALRKTRRHVHGFYLLPAHPRPAALV